jgi:hypothetical protein
MKNKTINYIDFLILLKEAKKLYKNLGTSYFNGSFTIMSSIAFDKKIYYDIDIHNKINENV